MTLWRFVYFIQGGITNRRVTVNWIMALAKNALWSIRAWKTRGKWSKLMLMVFRLEILTGDIWNPILSSKHYPYTPKLTRTLHTAYWPPCRQAAGGWCTSILEKEESLNATHCNYRPFSLSTLLIGFNIILFPSRSYWWSFFKRLPTQYYEIFRWAVSRVI